MHLPCSPAPDAHGTSLSTRPGAARRRGTARRDRLFAIGCLAVVTFTAATAAHAQGSRSRTSGTRFLDGLFQRSERTPALITVPAPPAEEELAALAREAARKSPPAAPSDPRPTPAAAENGAAKRATNTALAPAPALPTWSDTVAFGEALTGAARSLVADALDPAYRPEPRPKPVLAPVSTVVAKPAAARPTPPVAATSLAGTAPQPPRTARFERLRRLITDTLATYQRRPLNTAQHSPWEVMHGFIAFGIPTQVRVGGPAGELVNAIGWSNMGGRCRGQSMLATTGERLTALKGIGVQGHSAQYLAILAQCRVASSSPIRVNSQEFTVADLIAEEQLACREKTELTFALIAMAHYLPSDAVWTAADGQEWSLPRLVEEEITQPIRTAPCGGTHRLFGLAYACQRRLRATGALDGVYQAADTYVRDYQQLALTRLRNRDGSFSTEWFKYPADRDDDLDRKVQTTGHILEWLVASLDQDRLYDGRVVAAAEFLAQTLAREPSRNWKIGPLGHALHALNIYQERAWGVVLPGGVAAFHGPMKAAGTLVADKPESAAAGTRR
jgi:hypothetical protein